MTRKPWWRYSCEFCGKTGASGGHISRHEKACTANPQRICQMHKHCEEPQLPIAKLVEVLAAHRQDQNWDQAIKDLRKAADGCPACMLAAVRQSGIQQPYQSEDDPGFGFPFDFKAELKSFWDTINDAKYQAEVNSARYHG